MREVQFSAAQRKNEKSLTKSPIASHFLKIRGFPKDLSGDLGGDQDTG